MSAPILSTHARAKVDAVIAAYKAGNSYNTVGRACDVSTSAVQTIMRRFAPDSIRTSHQQQAETRIKPQSAGEGLTLASLGLMNVGPCRACGIEMVSETRENPVTGQTCG
ncbi:hypothetical protein LCGC14_2782440, partial [marine sediment metagenome]